VKWGGAVASMVLVTAGIGSLWWSASWWGKRADHIGIRGGAVFMGRLNYNIAPSARGFQIQRYSPFSFRWWYTSYQRPPSWQVDVPLWPMAVALIPLTAVAWWLDARARRRVRLGLCLKCGYDRKCLAAETVCPECDSASMPKQTTTP